MRRLIVVVVLLAAACGGGSADPERFCAIDADIDRYFLDFTSSPGEARAAAGQLRDLLAEGVEVAPDEIRGSVETAEEFYLRFLDVLETVDFDVARADQAALGPIFEDEAWLAAGTAIEAWVGANCSE